MNGFLTDNAGRKSSNRLIITAAFWLFFPAFSAAWTYLSFSKGELQDIPGGVDMMIGILLVGKALSKGVEVYGEIKKPTP